MMHVDPVLYVTATINPAAEQAVPLPCHCTGSGSGTGVSVLNRVLLLPLVFEMLDEYVYIIW